MGILRLYLALVVFEYHFGVGLYPVLPHSFAAVCIFFMISGFYMSLVLDGKYEHSAGGVLRFWAARALRLYPAYVVVLLGLLAASSAGLTLDPMWPSSPGVWLDQLLIFPSVLRAQLALEPSRNMLFLGQVSTVGLEMMFYALAPWLVRGRLAVLVALFALAAAAHAAPYFLGLPERDWQYEFFPSTLVFFLAGALAYRAHLGIAGVKVAAWQGYVALAVIVVYGARVHEQTKHFTNDRWSILLYAFAALGIPILFAATKESRVDRFVGSLSYPFYVVHAAVIEVVTAPVMGVPPAFAPACALALSLALALAMVLAIERPIDALLRQPLARHRPAFAPQPAE